MKRRRLPRRWDPRRRVVIVATAGARPALPESAEDRLYRAALLVEHLDRRSTEGANAELGRLLEAAYPTLTQQVH